MINCALSNTTVEKLYKSIYKHMSDSVKEGGSPFVPDDYMAYVFGNKAELSNPDTAAKLVQHIPRMIIDLYNTDFMQNPNFTRLDLNKLDTTARKYIDVNSGIQNVIADFKETSKKFLRAYSTTLKNEAGTVEEVDPEDTFTFPSERFMVYSSLSGTSQELIATDPTNLGLFIETLDQSKRTIYNTLEKIQAVTGGVDSILDKLTYQNKNLRLKALPLNAIDQSELDEYTRNLVIRSKSIKKTAKSAEGITPADEQVLLVISDDNNNFVYFTEDGDVTTKQEGGKLVYQFLRDTKKTGDRYITSNIYGYKTVLTPAEIAKALYKTTDLSVIESIDKEQQEEFKLLYELKERVLKGNEQVDLPIGGISNGVFEKYVGKTILLSELASRAEVDKQVFKSIKTVQNDRGSFKKGFATITVNGYELLIDRPDINADIARQVAKVLTNRNIPFKVRNDFYFQFFNNAIDYRARKHSTSSPDNQTLIFNYSNQTFQENKSRKFLENSIDLSQTSIENLSDSRLAEIEEIIFNTLMNGKGKAGKYFPTKLSFNSKLLKNERYQTYDLATNTIKFGNYIDFIKTLPATIKLAAVDKDIVNSYIIFGAPSRLNNFIVKAKEEDDKRTPTKKIKDELVDIVKEAGALDTTVKSAKSGFYMGKHYANYQVEVPGTEDTAKAYYPNKTLLITEGNKTVKDTAFPKEGEVVRLQVRDEATYNGVVYKDIIEIFKVNEDGTTGQYIGVIAEKDVSEYSQPALPEEAEELEIEVPSDEDKGEVSPEIDDIIQNEPINQPTNTNTNAGDLLGKNWKGLDRKGILVSDETKEQVEEATKWWNSDFNPLKGHIDLAHAANLVNSDVYARFITSAQTLLSGDTLGVIQINKGTMVDVYHEAWHAFSQLYLTNDQKTKLYNEVRNYKDSKNNQPYKNLTSLEIEEMLAEDFRSFAKNPKQDMKGMPTKKSIFKRILDFLKALFGKVSAAPVVVDKSAVVSQDYPTVVSELFNKLYFAGSSEKASKEFMNQYSPNIDNVMWDMLNRGVERIDARGEDALSRQDSILLSESIDSIISEMIDKLNSGFGVKSSSIKLLTDPENRAIAYSEVKEVLQEKLKEFKDELGSVTITDFNSLKTIEELSREASGIIKSSKEENKYIFLANQIQDFSSLTPDTKGGERIKGQDYFGIKIIADFYKHKDTGADIIIVKDIRDAEIQFDNYLKGGSKEFNSLEIKEGPQFKPLNYTEQQLLDNIRILQIAIDNWGDETKGVIKYHKENSSFSIIKEDYSEVEYNEVDENGELLDETDAETSEEGLVKTGEVGKKSLEQLAQKEALYIIKSLFKIQNGKTVNNRLGFKQLADFSKMWKIITREIGGVKDVQTMYDKLVNASIEYAPELKQLVEKKLPNPSQIKRTPEFDILSSVWQTFSRPRVPYMQLTAWLNEVYERDEFTGRGVKRIESAAVEVIDASIDASNIVRKFQAEFKAQSDKDNPYITKVENVTTLNDLNKLIKDFADPRNPNQLNINKSFEFARALGFMFDRVKIIENKLKNQSDFYGLPYIYKIVSDLANIQAKGTAAPKESLLVLGDFLSDPIRVLQSKIKGDILPSFKSKEVNQKNIVKRLAELQARYGFEGSNFSVMNPERNLVSEFIDDHSISRIVDAINRVSNIKQLYANSTAAENPFKYTSYLNPAINSFVNNNRSQILNSIFQTEGNGDKINGKSLKLFIDAGTQIANTDIGSTTTSLDIYSKFLQEMHLMLKGGIQEFIRHASKKSSFGAKVDGGLIQNPGKGEDPNLYVDLNMFGDAGGGEQYAVENILIPYLAAEFERISRFKENKDEFLKYGGYNKVVRIDSDGKKVYSGEVFTAFDNVLIDETKKLLLSDEFINAVKDSGLSFEEYLNTEKSGLKQRINNDMTQYFEQQTVENIKFLGAQEYIDQSLYDKLKSTKDKAAQKIAIVKAYTYNSWIHNFETINLFYGDMAQYNHLKEEMHKRNTGSTSGGYKFMTDTIAQDFINNIWNKDRVDNNGNIVERITYASKLANSTKNPEYNKFHYDGTFNTAVIKDVERSSIYVEPIEKALRAEYKRNGKSDEQINELLKKELKPYKEMNEADGAGYITIDAYRTLKKLENSWSNKHEELYKKIINNVPISASDVVNFFHVYKLQHFGAIANTDLPVFAMHKFALMPLIPSELGSSQLNHLHNEMLRNNIQYVTFESGSKVSGVTANGKPDQVFKDDSLKTLKNEIEFTPNTIYLEYLKNVTNVNSKYKKEITFPTQLRGLILDGIYNQGNITKPEFEKLASRYDNIVAEYTELLKLQLLNEIGYEKKDGKYVGNIKNFLELIQKELGKRDMPTHLLGSIGVDFNKNIKTDLSLHLEADTIERMLLSVLTKRLIRQKVKGEPLVQVPSSMYNGLWDTTVQFDKASEKDKMKYMGTNNLPFYNPGKNATNAMKVAIALQGDFVNLLKLEYNGKPIGDINTLNQAIKDDNWLDTGNNRKAITLAGARIPIQNLNSMEFAEVWHFLDPSAGNKVVVPTEIVAKAGSDFDVDKIFWMMPHITTQGEYVTGALSNEELNKKLAAIKAIKPKPGMKKPSAAGLIQKQKKALENALIEVTKDILATPGNYASLVRPNETHLVKGTADEFEPFVIEYNRYQNMHGEDQRMGPPDDSGKRKKAISPSRILEIGYNLHKHDVNMVGKDTLGIEALQNKKHPIFKSIGAKMPKTYKESVFDQASQKYVDKERDYDMRLLLPHAEIDGHISLSNDTNVSGTRIADIYSHIMNGLLDVEKDPWAFFIQANLESISILNYLIEAGVPEKTAIAFVSQPLIREYATNQKMLKSTFATLANKRTIGYSFIKYEAAKKIEAKIPYAKRVEYITKINVDNYDRAMAGLKDNTEIAVSLIGEPIQFTKAKNLKEFVNSKKLDISKINFIKAGDQTLFTKVKSLITGPAYYDAAVLASKEAGVLNDKGLFDEEMLINSIKDSKNPKYKALQTATFLHFLEIEKQIKGLESIKRQSNPDTKLLKTFQQIKKREQSFIDSLDSSKIDPELPQNIRNKSILRSFYQGDFALDLVEPVMPLRLNKEVSNFIASKINTDKDKISKKFGQGMEGEERFTSELNNAVINYIFQNYISNFVNDNGKIVELPDSYRGSKIIIKPGVKNGVQYDNDNKVIYVDRARLNSDFNDKVYLNSSNSANSYTAQGLLAFTSKDNLFPTQASYNKYVIEREYLRTIYSEAGISKQQFEKFLNQRALINSFNRDAIVGSDQYSYTDLVMKTVNEFSYLKETYPILAQISRLPYKGSEKIIQLNDKNIIKGELGDVYYQNLRELGDPYVRKVENDADNKRLSDVFRVFSLMMIHQHGVGYTKYGFNKALDDSKYLEIMRSAAGLFMNNNLNASSLSDIYNKLFSDSVFKNYVAEPSIFNSAENKTFPLTETLSTKAILDNIIEKIGEDQFNKVMENKYPDLSILDVPENLDLEKLYSEDYDEYVPVTYNAINIILDRLQTNGVNIDALNFLFNDFGSDTTFNIAEFGNMLYNDEELELEEEIEEEEAPIEEKTKLDYNTISSTSNPIRIYSDGSDIKGTGRVGFGAVYEYQGNMFGISGTEAGEDVKDLQEKFPGATFSNPTMEMLALTKVLETFQDTAEHLSIYQDYSGAVNYGPLWLRSEGSANRSAKPWKSKEAYIQYLIDRAAAAIEKIEANGGSVKINWVKGHSGDKMNDRADEYAKNRDNFNNLLEGLSKDILPATAKNARVFKGKMSYSYGENKRPGLQANSTIEAVATGERTATTRYSDQQAFNYWKNAKKGDIIEWVSDNGESVKVIVTKPLEKLVGSGKTPSQWTELEGWSLDYFNKAVRPKLDKAWQIEFEYIPNSYQAVVEDAEQPIIEPEGDYSVIEQFYFDVMEHKAVTGEDLISNLASLDELIDEYIQMYQETMTQEQFINFKRNCG